MYAESRKSRSRRDARPELLDRPPHEARHREEEARRGEHRPEAGGVDPGPAAEIGEETGEASHSGNIADAEGG